MGSDDVSLWHCESMLHEISASSVTASCRCWHRFQPCVVLAITSSGSCVCSFDACLRTPSKPRSRLSSFFGLITAIRCTWHSTRVDELPAVSSECCGTSHHWSQVVRAHHASPASVALAASLQTSGFQYIHPRLSFVGWHCSCVPS